MNDSRRRKCEVERDPKAEGTNLRGRLYLDGRENLTST